MKMKMNKKFVLILSMLFLLAVSSKKTAADPNESLVTVDSFVINEENDGVYNVTMVVTAEDAIPDGTYFDWKVYLVTNTSDVGTELRSGWSRIGDEINMDLNLSRMNSYPEYRFRIDIFYSMNDEEYSTSAFSMPFEYEQIAYTDDLEAMDVTVDVSGFEITVDWSNYAGYSNEYVVVNISVDGEQVIEELMANRDYHYSYIYSENAKEIAITLRNVDDGLASEGLTKVIDLTQSDTKGFHISFPEDNARFDAVWKLPYTGASETEIRWEDDYKEHTETLNGNGTLLIDIPEGSEKLVVEYVDEEQVKWHYNFLTITGVTAPTVSFLENYDGCKIARDEIMIVGMVDDRYATVTVEGVENYELTQEEDGSFRVNVALEEGKNTIEVYATNQLGMTSKSSVTVYRQTKEVKASLKKANPIKKYLPLIITGLCSVAAIVVLILGTKKRGKHEKTK